jgi:diamine N-acetyltransferase
MSEIILRAPEPEDIDLLYLWENDPDIWKVSNTITPFSRYILQKYIENAHLDIYQMKQLRLMIDVSEPEAETFTVGTVDLFDFDPFHQRVGIGILIGSQSHRHKGYASAALRKCIDYCFKTLQIHQLYCNITERNMESLRLFESCGFKITGRKTDWIKTDAGYQDELLLQLISKTDMNNQ